MILNKVVIIAGLLAFLLFSACSENGGISGGGSAIDTDNSGVQSYVFDTTTVPSIYITMDQADMNYFYTTAGRYTEEYKKAAVFHFVKNGVTNTVGEIGIRPRGNTSRDKGKIPFKISFSKFYNGRRFFSLKKLNLNPDINDPSLARRYIVHYMLRKMGVATSLVNHVRLFINGYYMGVYINTENIDKKLISREFGDTEDGNLYKCLWPAPLTETTAIELKAATHTPNGGIRPSCRAYELKINETADDYSGLADLTSTINGSPSQYDLSSRINIDTYLKNLAVTVMAGHWDNYWNNQQNYYLYQKSSDSKWEYFVYDPDNTFGCGDSWLSTDTTTWDFFNWNGMKNSSRPLVNAVLSIPAFVTQYSNNLIYIATNFYDPSSPNYLGIELDSLKARIQTAVSEDAVSSGRFLTNYYSAGGGDTHMFGWTADDFNNSYGTSYSSQHVGKGLKQYIAAMYSKAATDLDLSGSGGSSYTSTYSSMYVRGEFNSWGNSNPMSLITNNTWQAIIGGITSNQRFKFEVTGETNWGTHWGDDSQTNGICEVEGEGTAAITNYLTGTVVFTFNDATLAYSMALQ